MLIVLLLLLPLLGGLATWLFSERQAPYVATVFSLLTLGVAFTGLYQFQQHQPLYWSMAWIEKLGAVFALDLSDGLSVLMVLLTGLAFPLIYIAQFNKLPERARTFFSLMQFAQVGLMGVFLAKDALLFYVFWEVALIPVYFLSSMYGGPRRIPVTFKFFVYTFAGSLLMLIALLVIYQQTPVHSFSWNSFVSVGSTMNPGLQQALFWLMFLAFAIKMPVFPFHTWQPDAYEQSATPVTMVLSALMVKMGLFAVVRWLLPVLPDGCHHWMNLAMGLSVVGVVYASCMAMVQTNIKRLIAYSSVAHIGLMSAAIFSFELIGMQGVAVQMFNHGINILGMWVLVQVVEDRLKTQDLREMGGLAKAAPAFTIALVLISLANVALPLTNGFVGEFMMFNGLFRVASQYRIVFTVLAGLGIILSAVYTLTMVQKVAYGELSEKNAGFTDLQANEKLVLWVLMALILVLGFYPQLLLDLVKSQG